LFCGSQLPETGVPNIAMLNSMEKVQEESWKFLLTKMLILFQAGANFLYLANGKRMMT
jgi:hypothetical protein